MVSLALWTTLGHGKGSVAMMTQELAFGTRMEGHCHVTIGTLPSVGTILTDIRFVGSSTIEVEENIVRSIREDFCDLLHRGYRKHPEPEWDEIAVDNGDLATQIRF